MGNLFKTIGELARADGFLIVSCRRCKRSAVKDPWEIKNSGIPERYIDSLRFKCRCGSRDTLSYACLPATHEALEKAINGELDFMD